MCFLLLLSIKCTTGFDFVGRFQLVVWSKEVFPSFDDWSAEYVSLGVLLMLSPPGCMSSPPWFNTKSQRFCWRWSLPYLHHYLIELHHQLSRTTSRSCWYSTTKTLLQFFYLFRNPGITFLNHRFFLHYLFQQLFFLWLLNVIRNGWE